MTPLGNNTPRKKELRVEMDATSYYSFRETMIEQDMKLDELWQRVWDDFVLKMLLDGKGGKNARIRASIILRRQKDEALEEMQQVAIEVQKNPHDTDLYDRLESMCDIWDTSVELVMNGLSDDPTIRALIGERGTVAKAARWMAENMDTFQRYSSREIQDRMKEEGFSKKTFEAAKPLANVQSHHKYKTWDLIRLPLGHVPDPVELDAVE